MGGACCTCERNEKYNLKRRDHLEGLGIDRRIILDCILGKEHGKVWTGCIWVRIGTICRLL
jgi:hypothetical protein